MQETKGAEGGAYKPLSEQDIKIIHETSMRVFSEIGFRVNNKEALDLFSSSEAKIDNKKNRVKMDPERVMDLVGKAPSIIRLHGQKPEQTLEVGGKKVYAGTGGTALYVLDPLSGKKRPSTLSDLKDIAKIIECLDNIHFFMLPVFPHDVDKEDIDVNRFGVAMNYCSKHVIGGVYTLEGVRNVIRMAELISGSRESLIDKPIISIVTCCGISPFTLDDHYTRLTIEVAKAGIPVVTPVEPLCGATAPITLAGNLVVQNCDTLAGIMITQLVNPGTPVFYGCISSIADMKDMKYLSGAVEMGLMNAAACQLARFYQLPIYTTAGMSDSKTLDAQAGMESAITNLLVALAGGNFIHDAAGLLEFCMCASLEKYVIDDEILGMIMRAIKGIEVNPETLAFDLLKKIGPGGHFVASRHTRKFMRREQFMPNLCDRQRRNEWISKGSKNIMERAREKLEAILNHPDKHVIPEKTRQKIRSEIKGIDPRFI
jgi:trimethylamine--corrinoid protein Co-methyltransferase